jgi:hypothetical protein
MARTVSGACISALFVLYVQCCDVRACSRLCVRYSHRRVCCPYACMCVGVCFVRPMVRCIRVVCVGAGCSAVRTRVPWFVLCMIPAWVRTLPVLFVWLGVRAVPSGSGSPACGGGGGSPSCRRGVCVVKLALVAS